MDEHARIRRDRQRVAQQDTALDIVHLVIARRDQFLALDHQPGIAVAHFGKDPLRTRCNILIAEIIDRAAGRGEFLAAADRARVGGKAGDLGAAFAEAGAIGILPGGLRPIEATLIADQFRTVQLGLEVTPHRLGILALGADVETAIGRRVLDGRRVIAVDRIVPLGVETAEQRARVLFVELVEQVRQLLLARVGRRGQAPAIGNPALIVKGQTPIDIVAAIVRIVALHRVLRGIEAAMATGDVDDRHQELVPVGQIDRAAEELRRLPRTRHLDRDLVRTRRLDLLEHEAARRVDRHVHPEHGYARILASGIAADRDGGAVHGDVAGGALIVEHRPRADVLVGRHGGRGHAQRLHRGFVEPALGVVDAQDIAQRSLFIAVRRPEDRFAKAHRDHRLRRRIGVLARFEQAQFGLFDQRGIVRVHEERHALAARDDGPGRHHAQHRHRFERGYLNIDAGSRQIKVGCTLAIGGVGRIALGRRNAVDAEAERLGTAGIAAFQIGRDTPALDDAVVDQRAAATIGIVTAIGRAILQAFLILRPGGGCRREREDRDAERETGDQPAGHADHFAPPCAATGPATISSSITRR